MKKRIVSAALIVSLLFANPIVASSAESVEQPKNWGVMYQDASCIVMTNAGDDENPTENEIKMGYLHGNQLILLFSVSNKQHKGLKLPDGTKARFLVDGKPFKAMGVNIVGDQFIFTVDNSMELQKALMHAKKLAGEIKLPSKPGYILATELTLSNIPGAVRWLQACSVVGVGALPK